jgi:hypothetical protein
MRRNQRRAVGLGVCILGMMILSPVLPAQTAKPAAVPVADDWSQRHLIFSQPATAEQAARVQRDPRYWQQMHRSEFPIVLPLAQSGEPLDAELPDAASGVLREGSLGLGGLWEEDLGSGGNVGAGNFPAKYSLRGATANCGNATHPDFVVYSTGLSGSNTQASVVAYDNLYSGCTGTVPSGYWAYNTGGQILTSPVYSQDGTQVAFVQTAGEEGSLVLLKWAASTTEGVGTPKTLTGVSTATGYTTCPAPCMFEILLTNSSDTPANDTTSSAFYDYGSDTAYVGDSHGWLHKFNPVFLGTPTELRTGGWPVQVNPTNPNVLTDPVHDSATGNVFVGDAGGFLYRVNSTTAAVTKSGELDFGVGVVEGPVVDSTAGLVYVFASSDGTSNCAGGAACAAVYELTTSFAGGVGTKVEVGSSVVFGTTPNPSPLYIGAFNSAYENSVNATGTLYVCGNTGGPPILYQVPITAGAFGTVIAGPDLSNSTTPCSPVTDILNPNVTGGATEWMFASAEANGTSSACAAGGCAYNFKDTPWDASTAYTVGQEVVDSHFQIQVVSKAGTSGATAPTWKTTVGATTDDGTVHWLDQGLLSAFTPAAWKKNTAYAKDAIILDPNNNIELVTTAGTSGATIPTFKTAAGGVTIDGTIRWTNVGVIGTAALAAAGGTSGFIIDNVLEAAPGGSQVYFSTLSNQTCGTSGTGGCAVQASQSALK